MTRIDALQLIPYALPFARPFTTARGVTTAREGVLVVASSAWGDVGVGEAAPLPGFSDEALGEVYGDLGRACGVLRGASVPDTLDHVTAEVDALELKTPSARFAVEVMLLELCAKRHALPLARLLNPDALDRVRVNATLGAVTPEDVQAQARAARDAGFACAKLKVGGRAVEDDLARIAAAREGLGPDVALRLDANGAWTPAEARAVAAATHGWGLEWLEQPLPADDLDASSRLRRDCAVPIALDESIRAPQDLDAALDRDAADVVVLKPMLLGGLLPTLDMARRAQARGLTVVLTTTLDAAPARRAILHLAAALGDPDTAHGLATAALLASDVAPALKPERGVVSLSDAPGLGLDLAPDFAPTASAPSAVPHPLLQRARIQPEALAVDLSACGDEQVWTYGALRERADRAAAALWARGVRAGDRVAVAADNAPGLVALVHGLTRLGACLVAIHPRWTEAEAQDALDRVGASALVCDAAARVRWPGLDGWSLDALADGEGAPTPPRGALRDRWHLGALWALVFTSGTTGQAKAVALTYGNLVFSASASAARLGHARDDRWLAVLPLCHIGGLSILTRCLLMGTCAVVHPGFDAAAVADAITHGRASLASLVPTMLLAALDAMAPCARPHPRLRGVLLGGGPIPEALLARCAALGLPVAPTYGMTEGCSQLATAPFSAAPDPALGAGAPLLWTRLDLRPDAPGDGIATASEPGLIVAQGPTVSPGVWEEGRVVPRGPTLDTGDWGYWDPKTGGLRVVARRADRIVTGGENVAPAEVVMALEAHEGVAEAAVVGVPDPRWGQRVAAAVVARDAALDLDALSAFAAARLAPFKRPTRLMRLDALPRNALGKLDRVALRRLFETSPEP